MPKKTTTAKELVEKLSQEKQTLPNDIDLAERQAAEILKEKELLNRGLGEYFDLRKTWSKQIKIILWITTIFIIGMTVAIGLGHLNFDNYPYLPHSIIAGFFGEIVGICFIVAKFLFPNNVPKR